MPQEIAEVMTRSPIALNRTASLVEAAQVMRDRDVGDVVVMNDDGSVYGILTDRDLVIRAVAEGLDLRQTPLSEICTDELVTLTSSDPVARAIETMSDEAIRRLPVVDDGSLVGIVSLGDIAEERDEDSVLADISSATPDS